MSSTLYHVPKTISSPIVQALLEWKLVNNTVQVDTSTFADLKTPQHLARIPMGKSPAFADDENDIASQESGAAVTYLLETYHTNFALLYPQTGTATKAERAKFLQLQQSIVATVYPCVATLYIRTFMHKKRAR